MLITTMEGRSIALPFATITRARQLDGGDWAVTDSEGEEHRVDSVSWQCAVEFTPVVMMQALPGTYLVSIANDDGNSKVWKNNVLGWMICADTEIRPVVVDMSMTVGKGNWHILHPDGRVECKNGESWESLDSWIADSTTAQPDT